MARRRRTRLVLTIGGLAIGAWLLPKFVTLPFTVAEGYGPAGRPVSHSLSKVVADDRPPVRIDPDAAWRIEFGRGSGWHGLDTVAIDRDGRLVLHRLRSERREGGTTHSWETAAARLPADAVAGVLGAAEANGLPGLSRAYHADVADGTQWVLRVRQGEREKAVYFDNHFPDPIVRFADRLDEILAGSVGPDLKWQAVPAAWSRDHERELWESIRQ